ncbi:MAG: hypothetical protein AAB974_01990 [Patescibacteria group bacterium]
MIQQTNAEWDGHFAIGSVHSRSWISEKLILAKASHLANLCRYLATQVLASGCGTPDAVIGLAPDGIALAQGVGAPLATHFTDEAVANRFVSLYMDERYTLPSEYKAMLRGRNVVVVQSVIYTGKVTARLMDVVRSHGGTVVTVAALITRGRDTRQTIGNVPVIALYDYSAEDWPEADCPLCKEGIVPPTDLTTKRAPG